MNKTYFSDFCKNILLKIMIKYPLIPLLSSLNKEETREIRKFLLSPYYNHRQDVCDLFAFLMKMINEKRPIPIKEEIFKKIYGENKSFSDHQIRLIFSFLKKLIEKYLIQKKLTENTVAQQTILAEIYRHKNLPQHFERTLSKAEKNLEKRKIRNSNYYEQMFAIEQERYLFASSQKRTREMNLQVVSDTSDLQYFSRKLRQACLSLSHQKMYKTEYDLGMLSQILVYVEERNLLKFPAIAAYYHAYQLLAKEIATESFNSFLDLLLKSESKFPEEEERGLYLMGINYCIRRYNQGDKAIAAENFTLSREGLEKGYLFTDGKLSHFTYRNIVSIALIQKEYDWLEKFIFDYKNSLGETHKESTFSFSLARLKYARQDYQTALSLLQKADFSEALPSLSARMLMLKIFYELEEFDLLEAHLQAMKTFIRRKKSLGYHRDNYLNTLRFVRKRIEIAPFEKEKMQNWRKEIENTASVAEKEWLLNL